jgi:hypothetical protein
MERDQIESDKIRLNRIRFDMTRLDMIGQAGTRCTGPEQKIATFSRKWAFRRSRNGGGKRGFPSRTRPRVF